MHAHMHTHTHTHTLQNSFTDTWAITCTCTALISDPNWCADGHRHPEKGTPRLPCCRWWSLACILCFLGLNAYLNPRRPPCMYLLPHELQISFQLITSRSSSTTTLPHNGQQPGKGAQHMYHLFTLWWSLSHAATRGGKGKRKPRN